MKFFIILKDKSVRVPNKNFLDLGGMPLWVRMIEKLSTQDVYVDTDSKLILNECLAHYKWVHAYERSIEHINLENNNSFKVSPVLLMIKRFLDKYVSDENEIIVTPHVTSPFITLDTILKASTFLNNGVDSVQSCVEHYEFCYFKKKPINFDPRVVQKTQDLEPVVMGNGAFFIFTKKTFIENNNRTGKNPYFYPLNFLEGFEIDYPEDYMIAKKLL